MVVLSNMTVTVDDGSVCVGGVGVLHAVFANSVFSITVDYG